MSSQSYKFEVLKATETLVSKLLTAVLHAVMAAAISQTASKVTRSSPRNPFMVDSRSTGEHASTSPGDHSLIIALTSLPHDEFEGWMGGGRLHPWMTLARPLSYFPRALATPGIKITKLSRYLSS